VNISNMQVYFASDLKDYGFTEDGEPFIGEVFFVEVEDAQGNRWRHHRKFDGVRKEFNEFVGAYAYLDNRDWARQQAQKWVDVIVAAGEINPAYWSQARPAYGSEAYMAYGQAEDVALERSER
jgi:hypothetical protein